MALDKKSMACNKPRTSPNPKKKNVVKACENGQEVRAPSPCDARYRRRG